MMRLVERATHPWALAGGMAARREANSRAKPLQLIPNEWIALLGCRPRCCGMECKSVDLEIPLILEFSCPRCLLFSLSICHTSPTQSQPPSGHSNKYIYYIFGCVEPIKFQAYIFKNQNLNSGDISSHEYGIFFVAELWGVCCIEIFVRIFFKEVHLIHPLHKY